MRLLPEAKIIKVITIYSLSAFGEVDIEFVVVGQRCVEADECAFHLERRLLDGLTGVVIDSTVDEHSRTAEAAHDGHENIVGTFVIRLSIYIGAYQMVATAVDHIGHRNLIEKRQRCSAGGVDALGVEVVGG